MSKYRRLLAYAGTERFYFLLIFALTPLTAALVALQPWPMKLLADQVLGGQPVSRRLGSIFDMLSLTTSPANLLLAVVVSLFGLFLLNSLVDILLVRAWTVAGRRMVYNLAGDLFVRVLHRSLTFHSRNAVGETMSRVTTDSWCVYQILDALLAKPLQAILSLTFIFLLMTRLDATLAVVALVIAIAMVAASFLVTKPLQAAAKLKRDVEGKIQSHLQQTLTGIPVVQAFTQEEREQLRFSAFAREAVRAQQQAVLMGSLKGLGAGLIVAVGTGAILWLGASHVLAGRLTIGGILIFVIYLNSMQAHLKVLAGVHTSLQTFHASVERVIEVLKAPSEIEDKIGAITLSRCRGALQFDHVTVGYERGRPVLRELSLEIAPGEVIGIVGESGAGKSTLAGLAPRFFDPWDGRVLLDGIDLREIQLSSLRAQVAVVLQEPFLFPASISENIAFGKPGATMNEIQASARAAGAHEFIVRQPHGYETVLGESGVTLSGGERQRLAIARALLKNAPILILDEPTSALDLATEHSMMTVLEELMRGRTTLLIAHRLSTVRRANRIVVLQEGTVAEIGTHAELIARGGVFARLYHAQASTPTPGDV